MSEAVAVGVSIPKDQRLTYRITPLPGRLMSAESIGGQLSALSDLLKTLAGQNNTSKWNVLLTRIETAASGEVSFDLLIAPEVDKAETATPLPAKEDA